MADEVELESVEALPIPVYAASSVKAASNGLEFMLTFSTMVPIASDDGVGMRPNVAVTIPRGTASDLLVVLKGLVDRVDADFGSIDTPFQKEQRESKQ